MKLRAGDLNTALQRGLAGVLIFGPDPVTVGLRRDEALLAAAGPEADADMRLTRLQGTALRSDPAALSDAMRARGFFPGPRAVVVDGANDGLTDMLAEALTASLPGEDAVVIATAGPLPTRSKLRTLFEGAQHAAACQLFDDPPGSRELAALLREAGAQAVQPDAVDALVGQAASLDAGSLRQLCRTVVLHAGTEAVTARDVAACAPDAIEGAFDAVAAASAEGRVAVLAAQLARLAAQGVAPTTLCIAASRHFRRLHALACDAAGPETAAARLRPPVYGAQRTALVAQARRLGVQRLERILRLLTETDFALRSGSSSAAPDRALIGHALMRIAKAVR
ncbi:MAG: DNA polymerase III subunit delta [Pseudomonadota bacterium]